MMMVSMLRFQIIKSNNQIFPVSFNSHLVLINLSFFVGFFFFKKICVLSDGKVVTYTFLMFRV